MQAPTCKQNGSTELSNLHPQELRQNIKKGSYSDGVDEGGDAKWQAAADHGEDGVAQVVFDRVFQRVWGHKHGGLDHDSTGLSWVLLAHGVRLPVVPYTVLLGHPMALKSNKQNTVSINDSSRVAPMGKHEFKSNSEVITPNTEVKHLFEFSSFFVVFNLVYISYFIHDPSL